jgi:predicted dehydrogenase
VTPRLSDVLETENIEAVVVALPMRMHHPVGLRTLQAGKHVLVEKPLATTIAECDELVAAAESRGLTLMVGHTFLFNGGVERAREFLAAGELGEPYYVSMRRTNLGIVRSDGNAMWSLAPHDISILRYWLDADPVAVSATGVSHLQPGIEDVTFLTVWFPDGVIGHIHCSWLEPHKVRDATLVGSRKMIVYDDTAPETKIWLYDKGIEKQHLREHSDSFPNLGRYDTFSRFQMIARAGDVVLPKLELREPLARQIEHFANVIRGGEDRLVAGSDGRAVVAVLVAAQKSLEERGAVQDIRRP